MTAEQMQLALLVVAAIPAVGNLAIYALRFFGAERAASFLEGAIPLALSAMHAATKDGK
tara:strand:+ start:958 stop:1134 length:177 start_codon:yes stop_codon:yes gene_type:complete